MSAKVRDMLGNVLRKGNVVTVVPGSPTIFVIKEIVEELAPTDKIPVSVVLQAQLTIMSSADDCISNVVKVIKPQKRRSRRDSSR